jgi:hypothetical protein
MQMMPSAEATGQGDCEASRTTGAHTFVTRVAFTHAAILCKGFGLKELTLSAIGLAPLKNRLAFTV